MLVLNKDYVIFKPETKYTKSGKQVMKFVVSDSMPIGDGKFKNDYYNMKVYTNDDLILEDRQKVKFTSFFAISTYVNEANGKTYFNKDVYCTIEGYPFDMKEKSNGNTEEKEQKEEEVDLTDDIPF